MNIDSHGFAVGTYEKRIHLFKINSDLSFIYICSFQSHDGYITSLAFDGKQYMASGSTDENINIYQITSLGSNIEYGSISKSFGTIKSLCFFNSEYLFSTHEQGFINFFRISDWDCFASLPCNRENINSFAVHPSGKIALTLSNNQNFRIWDLKNGKCACNDHFKYPFHQIRWSTNGSIYSLIGKRFVMLFTSQGDKICKIKHHSDITSFEFFNSQNQFDSFILGCLDGSINIFNYNNSFWSLDFTFPIQNNRIKDLSLMLYQDNQYLLSVCSNGNISLWNLQSHALCHTLQINDRITCCCSIQY